MSTGLMSCVRENSPPLEVSGNGSGAFSLPTSGSESQKRRRFHPLRNLRRIFRRRTLNSVGTTTPPISSPSSPLSQQQNESPIPNIIASVPAHNLPPSTAYKSSAAVAVISGGASSSSVAVDVTAMSSTTYPPHLIGLSTSRGISSCAVSIIPPLSSSASSSGGFFIREAREHSDNGLKSKENSANDLEDNREMTDCQRSFSEGRLLDSDFSRDGLSQSHDSVFSESATASSLSIVLKAELFDVLRKRRNRPDASEEDLGLPRSPTTPHRKDQTINQSEVSSLSLLSMASSDLDEELSSNFGLADKTNSSISSKMSSHDTSKTSDEIDFIVSSSGSRLSHSAAKHKMAVRPKKKGPSRHRRPIENTVLPSTPEVNEDVLKISLENKDIVEKGKSHSLPSGVNAKVLEQHNYESSKGASTHIKRSKTEKVISSTTTSLVKSVSKSCATNAEFEASTTLNCAANKKEEDSGFFRRLMQRNSRKNKKLTEDCGKEEKQTSFVPDVVEERNVIEKCEEYSNKIKETRHEIKKELLEGKSNLNSTINTHILSSDSEMEPEPVQRIHKPKSGAAARQRIMPKDLPSSPSYDVKSTDKTFSEQIIEQKKSNIEALNIKPSVDISNSANTEVNFSDENLSSSQELVLLPKKHENSNISEENVLIEPRLVKSLTEESFKNISSTRETSSVDHFEKRERMQPKIIGLSSFQQKVSKTENFTLSSTRPIPKQRKYVEKSKSFRYYSEGADSEKEYNLKKYDNMPSLPDLTFSRQHMENNTQSESINKSSLAFEINDNNLMRLRKEEEPNPLCQGIYAKNIILTTSKPSSIVTKQLNPSCNQNITQIEENIDKLVKSPFVTVLKKSNTSGEIFETKATTKKCIISPNKAEITFEKEEKKEIVKKSLICEIKSKSETLENKDTHLDQNELKSVEPTSTATEVATIKNEMRLKDNVKQSNNVTKARRSSSVLDKFESNQIPEFMKIQLNRVDFTKPKSNVVLSKNVREPDDKETVRRYSNDSIEITENKVPLQLESTKRSTCIASTARIPEESIIKSPVIKVDEENNVLKNFENTQSNQMILERRKGVTDEKLKYEKKIEELKLDKKKPTEDNRSIDLKKFEEETSVVLRKKSFPTVNQSSNKEDTPELMKVFARRSLKIKDEEIQSTFEEIEKANSLRKFTNLDSDKENQSSSEEKLDKFPKIEITIQSKPQASGGLIQKVEEKSRNSLVEFRKPNSSITSTSTKSYISPIRYSNIGYRNISSIYGKQTQLTSTTITATTSISSSQSSLVEQSSSNNISEHNNNNSANINSSSNSNNKTNIRHTIGPTNQATFIDQAADNSEFKGILQRRAEWEKRAKEALK